jgi:type IV pilus assembly protein PilB
MIFSPRQPPPAPPPAPPRTTTPTPPQPEDSADLELELNPSGDPNGSPVVSLVDRLLVEALSRGASDIHVEPQEETLLVRLRQDGVLEELESLP